MNTRQKVATGSPVHCATGEGNLLAQKSSYAGSPSAAVEASVVEGGNRPIANTSPTTSLAQLHLVQPPNPELRLAGSVPRGRHRDRLGGSTELALEPGLEKAHGDKHAPAFAFCALRLLVVSVRHLSALVW